MNPKKIFDEVTFGMTEAEQELYAHMKRFFECYYGYSDFYEAVTASPETSVPILEAKGIYGIDPVQMIALVENRTQIQDLEISTFKNSQQIELWMRRHEAVNTVRDKWLQWIRTTSSERFNKWHKRQMIRCESQLPQMTSTSLTHGTLAFELSQGCSIQCPFCALATESLKEWLPYTDESKGIWRETIKVLQKHLGDSIGGGVCYWATEPTDNPDYIHFVRDFGALTGIYPQTTTAAALRDLNWTNDLLELRKRHPGNLDRFSVLSENVLKRLHALYSAEELMYTELLPQFTDRVQSVMSPSGRNRQEGIVYSDVIKDHTVACVTGYLINMVEGTVSLITPCPPTDENPKGYQTCALGYFETPQELDLFIGKTIESMHGTVRSEQILAFREDLKYVPLENGFKLQNAYKAHIFRGESHLKHLGELIDQGRLNTSEIIDRVSHRHMNILGVVQSIQQIFDQGLLEEDFIF